MEQKSLHQNRMSSELGWGETPDTQPAEDMNGETAGDDEQSGSDNEGDDSDSNQDEDGEGEQQ